MMSGGVRDVEIPVCNVDLSTRTSCVHDLVTFWASHADLAADTDGPSHIIIAGKVAAVAVCHASFGH